MIEAVHKSKLQYKNHRDKRNKKLKLNKDENHYLSYTYMSVDRPQVSRRRSVIKQFVKIRIFNGKIKWFKNSGAQGFPQKIAFFTTFSSNKHMIIWQVKWTNDAVY